MKGVLEGKRLLVVDDEPDVNGLVTDELSRCQVDTAVTYEEARAMLERQSYDAVILDIQGVRGFELLAEFAAKAPCIVLTAHALTPADLRRTIAGRAVLFLPKEEIGRLDEYVAKALCAKEPLWSWLFRRLDLGRWLGRGYSPDDLLEIEKTLKGPGEGRRS